jgi:hypothetical protein
MDFSDAPKAVDMVRVDRLQDVIRVAGGRSRLTADALFILAKANEKTGAGSQSASGKGMELQDQGQIDKVTLPKGWVIGKLPAGATTSGTLKLFSPADDPDARLGFFYRGQRTSDSSGAAFKSVLEKPAHTLTPAEIAEVKEVLRDKDPASFKTLSVRTEDLAGRRVLIVEGTYTGFNHDAYSIYVDSDGTGSAVQELWFEAPKASYVKQLKSVKDSLSSIKWK